MRFEQNRPKAILTPLAVTIINGSLIISALIVNADDVPGVDSSFQFARNLQRDR
jgi:hypothetical protein